jgi:CRP-like cAMP-binding protein
MSALAESNGRSRAGANQLLAVLASDHAARVESVLEPVQVARGDVLISPGQFQAQVYFPIDCLLSVVIQLTDGARAEVGLIGSEGFVGLPVLLEAEPGSYAVVCQIAGRALRMSARNFLAVTRRVGTFRRVLLRYAGVRLLEETHAAACLGLHSVTPRLAA